MLASTTPFGGQCGVTPPFGQRCRGVSGTLSPSKCLWSYPSSRTKSSVGQQGKEKLGRDRQVTRKQTISQTCLLLSCPVHPGLSAHLALPTASVWGAGLSCSAQGRPIMGPELGT